MPANRKTALTSSPVNPGEKQQHVAPPLPSSDVGLWDQPFESTLLEQPLDFPSWDHQFDINALEQQLDVDSLEQQLALNPWEQQQAAAPPVPSFDANAGVKQQHVGKLQATGKLLIVR